MERMHGPLVRLGDDELSGVSGGCHGRRRRRHHRRGSPLPGGAIESAPEGGIPGGVIESAPERGIEGALDLLAAGARVKF